MFQYDPFQIEAINHIKNSDSVIVSAPTGAGKTVIAEAAIDFAMEQGKQAIYTAPVKALSNQKYRDFKEKYGDEAVGILTGDVSINAHAPIVIMTTEIFRNTLFENLRRVEEVSWVIFDEIHYLDDLERGTVWEESIMFLPEHISFVGLSATVPNVDQIAEWVESIHNKKVHVIKESHRPVPLSHRFQCQNKLMSSKKALLKEGYGHMPDWNNKRSGFRNQKGGHKNKLKFNRLPQLIKHIQQNHELPCIYFVFSRKKARELAEEVVHFEFLNAAESKETINMYWALCEKYSLTNDRSAHELSSLIRNGIAHHHAGMLPTLKEVVEQLFTSKKLKLIFTTETFAIGINMPARCVVFDELRKYSGTGFGNLRTRDYFQMAGRAGRRGMDECGTVYSRINPKYISHNDVVDIIYGQTEPVISQFNATYATVLNLYALFAEDLLSVYPRSLHYFQSSKKKHKKATALLERKILLLKDMGYIADGKLTDKGLFASSLYGYELTLAEMHEDGYLATLGDIDLAMLLIALIFEPRKNDQAPMPAQSIMNIANVTQKYLTHVHEKESKHHIFPPSKLTYFHLAETLGSWMYGRSFEDVLSLSNVDEGEVVRYFRMVIQLLRQVINAHGTVESTKKAAKSAIGKINRDIVDAEKQLSV